MNNSLYLKRYVETHPDNKMAWYLLGKDYAANGEIGKANYCFNRAGEVYEAFELSKVPSHIWENYESRLLEIERERDKRGRRIRRVLFVLVMMLLVLLPSVHAPDKSPAHIASSHPGDIQWPEFSEAEVGDKADAKTNSLFTAVAARNHKWPDVVARFLTVPDRLPSSTIILGMERAGKFDVWSDQMPVLYGIHRNTAGAVTIEPFKGVQDECSCSPQDDKPLKGAAEKWANFQVQYAVLSEAIKQFREHNSRLPNHLDELTRPFPNNWLSGQSAEMNWLFPVLTGREKAVVGKGASESNRSQAEELVTESLPSGLGAFPDGQAFFKQPLEVIIDRKNHRLAVVSGSILLRNYEVGLGRDNKTPLGRFQISDKVINPNGSATGTYGSRGMQLSDTNYAIHGTQDIKSIGGNESEGCIRMHKRDVEELFDLVPMGTQVRIGEGVLPAGLVVPKERFSLIHAAEQSNPRKEYNWLD
ncbi:L,D-transpeptidase [Paenibacillus dakarensis]|uniref:L,D-transpeptidase n=1 Tax=Paenibacillus dakarensis TaxID=1527293 RepID=UPI0006D5563D|nr:L,D-transpeptidase [Paenibacillus dakarensis]